MPRQAVEQGDDAALISGDALKREAAAFVAEMRTRVVQEQNGLLSVFDSWFSRVFRKLSSLDADRSWEDSLADPRSRQADEDLRWDLLRLKLFLDRRHRGRFVDYRSREQSGTHYHPRFGTEFGPDVLLTCQGAPSLMRWRGRPLMKNVFDFAMYPALLSELRPRTIFEIGSGSGASAAWLADHLAFNGIEGCVHSVDLAKASPDHPNVAFHQGDCTHPESLFPIDLLREAPHPWLVIEDAHQNVSAVLDYFHRVLQAGDYLVVEDSDVKRDAIRQFTDAHRGEYLVDTRFTDNFGRNATCAADSIFRKVGGDAATIGPPAAATGAAADRDAAERVIPLGDPAPWFGAPIVGEGTFNLQVAAGRWVVLAFLDAAALDALEKALDGLIADLKFDDDHVIFCGILTEPPAAPERLIRYNSEAVRFVSDYDRRISRSFGAAGQPRIVVLDPMLRVIANIAPTDAEQNFSALREVVKSLPRVDDSVGVPLTAPALIVPRVLDFPLCETLIRVFDQLGGDESGFLVDLAGKSTRIIDHRLKRRSDLVVVHPVLRGAIRSQLARRLVPAIERFFQFKATRIDRYIVSCYDSAVAAHFQRHRDNENAGAQHRRFAVTINLNKDYQGGDLIFPEFGRRAYRAPAGGAVVFSCGALHQVTPVTTGRRYAFLAFLYGEADVAVREANNAKLHPEAAHYVAGSDLLFPNAV